MDLYKDQFDTPTTFGDRVRIGVTCTGPGRVVIQ